MHNAKELKSTGGGPNTLNQFSNLESEVIDLINLKTCCDPPGRSFGLKENDGGENNIQNIIGDDIRSNEDNDVTDITNSSGQALEFESISPRPRSGKNKSSRRANVGPLTDERMEFLKRQTLNFEELKNGLTNDLQEIIRIKKEETTDLKEIKMYLKELCEYQRKIYYLKKDKFKLKKEKFDFYKAKVMKNQKDRFPY